MFRTTSYFACSFDAPDAKDRKDERLSEWFRSICHGLSIQTVNVNTAFAEAPLQVAIEKVKEVSGCVAIVTRRTKVHGGKFHMPTAVQNEIMIAVTSKLPVLVFCEAGVVMDGFNPSVGTYLPFVRTELRDPDFIQKVVQAIDEFRNAIALRLGAQQYVFSSDYSSLQTACVMELKPNARTFTWHNSITKHLQFNDDFDSYITSSFWPVPGWESPNPDEEGVYDFTIDGTEQQFMAHKEPVTLTNTHLDLRITFLHHRGRTMSSNTHALLLETFFSHSLLVKLPTVHLQS